MVVLIKCRLLPVPLNIPALVRQADIMLSAAGCASPPGNWRTCSLTAIPSPPLAGSASRSVPCCVLRDVAPFDAIHLSGPWRNLSGEPARNDALAI